MVVKIDLPSEPKEYAGDEGATIALDYGSTKIRAICTRQNYFEPKLIMLEPYVTKVGRKSFEESEKNPFAGNGLGDRSWVKHEDNYYALGFLAKQNYGATLTLEPLKIDLAIPQTLGIIGSMASLLDLGETFSLNLGALLPWGEYKGRDRLRILLEKALARFIYRGKEYKVKLNEFICLPEGGGLFARGCPPQKKSSVGEMKIWILNVGYRNASLLFVERGNLVKGFTSELGFGMCIEKIKNYTAGWPEVELLSAICRHRKGISDRTLSKLIKSTKSSTIANETERIREAKAVFIPEYVGILSDWCALKMHPRSDYALIGGGTGHFLKPELNEKLVLATAIPTYWCNLLEQQVKRTFSCTRELAGRLTDLYGFFFYFVDRIKQKQQS